MRLIPLLLLLATLTGCSAYTQTQSALVDQARKGVALWSAREQSRDADIQAVYNAKKSALDRAFDLDAQSQSNLDAAWVIEARKAYAIALGQLTQSQSTALTANQTARDNAAATDAALARLAWLLSIQTGVQIDLESVLKLHPKGGPQ